MNPTVKYRNWGKYEIVEWLFCNKKHNIAEIGVYNGQFMIPWALLNKELSLLLVDPYKHFPKEIYNDTSNHPQVVQDARYELVKAMIAPMSDRCQLWRMTSAEAAKLVPASSLDFIYIDANHAEESVTADLHAWWPKLKDDGLFAGHDYNDLHMGVKHAVGKFVTEHKIPLLQIAKADDIWLFKKETE